MYFWFGNALSIIISYLIKAAPGIAIGALVYTFLHLTVQRSEEHTSELQSQP